MTLRVAFQMDPMESVDIDADTTFALAEVAAARGMILFEYAPEHLAYNEGRIEAYARPMTVRREYGNHVTFEPRRKIDLASDVDVVWMRQDPPFDMAYITAAHLLERLKGDTLVVNDPEWVRSCPEKILPLVYDELRRLAAAKLQKEPSGQTLQPTALVHEAWLRLNGPAGGDQPSWSHRGHFFAAASEAMRRILIDSARKKQRIKRGEGPLEMMTNMIQKIKLYRKEYLCNEASSINVQV